MKKNDILNKVIGKKITSYDVSDDGTCIVLLFEDEKEPIILNMYSSKEIKVDSN